MEPQNASRASGPRSESRAPRVVGGLLDGILERWRDLTARRSGRGRDLSEEDAERLRERIVAVLDGGGGEVSARAVAVEMAATYLDLSEAGRRRLLAVLASDLGVDRDAADAAARRCWRLPRTITRRRRTVVARRAPTASRAPARPAHDVPHGVRFLVDLRADALRASTGGMPQLLPLADDLLDQLRALFDVGLLELERVTWDSPASLLEKLARYEAVHDVASWDDLKNRLDRDRRMFAFFHPSMPDEPLIFVEVALTRGLAGEIAPLLDVDAPPDDPARADTAIFYSISSAQEGLSGVGFGGFLIKRVVDELRSELPRLRTFATLSPIPGFARWLARELGSGGHVRLTGEERRALGTATGVAAFDERALLARLADHRLAQRRGRGGRAQSPAAAAMRGLPAHRAPSRPQRARSSCDFHLGNGARIERLDWLGDPSPKGIAQAHGLMVNYLYRLEWIEENHEAYTARGEVRAAGDVIRLIEAGRGERGSK